MQKITAESFEKKTGYKFANINLLVNAFTHSSYANELKKDEADNNERLEFLGDAVLELAISEYIYTKFPTMPEGEMTKLRASIVCEATLSKLARKLGYGNFLLLGRGEDSTGGRDRDSILADAFEAVLGAIFIDGGLNASKSFMLRIIAPQIDQIKKSFRVNDCKTHLQELLQKSSKEPIEYVIISEKGPDHNKLFESQVIHSGRILGHGSGKSKKEAEQNAALAALEKIEFKED